MSKQQQHHENRGKFSNIHVLHTENNENKKDDFYKVDNHCLVDDSKSETESESKTKEEKEEEEDEMKQETWTNPN